MKTEQASFTWQTEEKPPRKVKSWHLKNILVPLDFSRESVFALRHARAMADREGASLILLTVIEEPVSFRPLDLPCRQRCRIQSVAARLQEIAERELAPGAHAHIVIGEGSVASAIARVAGDKGAGLIVMGRHRHGGWRRWFRKNVITRVMACAPCPVVAVNRVPGPAPASHVNLVECLTSPAPPADGSQCLAQSGDASRRTRHPTVSGAHA